MTDKRETKATIQRPFSDAILAYIDSIDALMREKLDKCKIVLPVDKHPDFYEIVRYIVKERWRVPFIIEEYCDKIV